MPILSFSPTVTVDTSAMTTGDVVGTLMTLDAGTSGFIRGATLISDTIATAYFDLFLYSANPSASTYTNNAAHSIASADQAKVLEVLHLSDVTPDGNCSIHASVNQAVPFVSATGLLYASLVVRATVTFAATTDVALRIYVQREF